MGQDEQSELSFREDDDLRMVRPEPTICKIPRSTFIVCGFGILLAFAVIGVSMAMMHSALPAFHETIAAEDIFVHLTAFQTIADNNNGSRSITRGFNESVQHVLAILGETKLNVQQQEFEVRVYQETAPSTLAVEGQDGNYVSQDSNQFKALSYSGSGEAIGLVSLVKEDGCEESHFDDIPSGRIVLIKRFENGNCNFNQKATIAQRAGAIAVIIINYGAVITGTLGSDSSITIPVIAVSDTLGADLSAVEKNVKLSVSGTTSIHISYNILAETNHGSEKDVVVIGSHLDSVDGAAGINDNGSGSAANLVLALAFHNNALRPKNRVIFAWFGGEENGLVGSKYFVNSLKKAETLTNVAAYLNMDMIGSPNYFRGIYNGEEAKNETIRLGSAHIQKYFEAHFEEHFLEYEATPFDSRSDYGPFIENGIPAGGVFSGAEGLKTMDQRKKFGGLALVPYDPCYHLACDSIENINKEALYELTRAVANVLYDMSHDSDLRGSLKLELTAP